MKEFSLGTLGYFQFLSKHRELHFDFCDRDDVDSKFVVGLRTTPKTLEPRHRPIP